MPHQKYIIIQMNVCKGYNDSRGEQKRNEKCGVSLVIPCWRTLCRFKLKLHL